LKQCTLPLTGARVVDLVITDLAVFAVDKAAATLKLLELASGVSLDHLRDLTAASFIA
jgi:3-oxoacid CoA-transferase subunit B